MIELCSYGDTADFEAIDFDADELDLNYTPEGWTPRGGGDEARRFTKRNITLTVYREGRIISSDMPTSTGRDELKLILESWHRNI